MSARRASPFSPRVMLGLVLFGALAFLAMLWMIGSGMDDPAPGARGAHAMGKGLDGYAALNHYLDKRGFDVSEVQSRAALKRPGVLILTPMHFSDPEELNTVVNNRREVGPTIIILPKWISAPLPRKSAKVKEGFVDLVDAVPPQWKGFYDDISLNRGALETGAEPGGWEGAGLDGRLPLTKPVFSGEGDALIPLVFGKGTDQVLAGYIADGGDYPLLRAISDDYEDYQGPFDGETAHPWPVIMVFDADLFNNYGLARQENALLAEKLIIAALNGGEKTVIFDLTLNGYGRSQSLLSLAFTPPFLAATLCLIMAAAVALWRAYQRFGPPVLTGRTIAFGKRTLVANAAGLVQRARRLHLLGPPYADAARERLVRALALPARLSHAEAEKAIDRAQAARAPDSPPFSQLAAQMRAARKPTDMLRTARQLHALERTLTR